MLTTPPSVQPIPPPRLLHNRIHANRVMGITRDCRRSSERPLGALNSDRAGPRLDRVVVLGDGSMAARARRALGSGDREGGA